jgi:hypothetical protein
VFNGLETEVILDSRAAVTFISQKLLQALNKDDRTIPYGDRNGKQQQSHCGGHHRTYHSLGQHLESSNQCVSHADETLTNRTGHGLVRRIWSLNLPERPVTALYQSKAKPTKSTAKVAELRNPAQGVIKSCRQL